MQYTRQHLIGSCILIIGQILATLNGKEQLAIILGWAQLPFILLPIKTMFFTHEEEES